MAPEEVPWKTPFLLHLKAIHDTNAEVQLSLATVTTPDNLPRVRTVGHAGFWSVNSAASEATSVSCCLTFITNSRFNKVADVFGQIDQLPEDFETYGLASGGGGPVEAVYWLEQIKMQWRMRGRCFFVTDGRAAAGSLAGEDEQERERRRREGLAVTKAAVRPHMVGVVDEQQVNGIEDGGDADVDSIWEAEVQGYYQRLSLEIQPLFLRSSFAVGIIVPEEVEMMDLTDATVTRRRIWKSTNTIKNGVLEWSVVWDNS
ncbi:hypothetical protein MMC10_007116 [Thelotrema lepadinum]|nr:hypothetical protein [Thelotrema lepadinum]